MKKEKKIMIYLLVCLIVFSHPLFVAAGEKAEKKEQKPSSEKKEFLLPPVPVPDNMKSLAADTLPYEDIAFFFRTLEMISRTYVDKEKVTTKELLMKALRGLVKELDPFSAYISKEQAALLEEDTKGSFAGIGVSVLSRGHVVEVINVFEGSPAEKAGVRAGDLLVGVDGKSVSGVDLESCIKLIKGEKGSLVRLKIMRRGKNAPLILTVRRDNIKISSVVNQGVLRGQFGYFRITQFTASTGEDLKKAVENLKKKNIKGLVIDLRNNPGGLLVAAIAAGSIFLDTGLEIVSTSGRLPESRQTFRSLKVPKAPSWPMVILINGSSASAAEIFAGSLRDNRRAVLAGVRSFGKGSVQTIMPLGNHTGSLRLTTAKYYTPSKKVIHKVGIMPDIVIPVTAGEQFELNTLFLGRMVRSEAELKKIALKDKQLQRALDILQAVSLLRKEK